MLIGDFSHAILWFWVEKPDYVRVSRLRSSIFFLAFVLFLHFDFAKLGGPKKDSRHICLSFFNNTGFAKHLFAKSLSLFDFFVICFFQN